MSGRPSAGRSLALLVLCAAGIVAAHPPGGMPLLALFMWAPLAAALEGRAPREAAAWAGGAVFVACAVVGRWLVHALAVEYGVGTLQAWAFTFCAAAAVALPVAAALAGLAALRARISPWLAPLCFGAAVAGAEWLRSELMGLPWILTAQAAAPEPILVQTADLGGVVLVSFLLAALGGGVGLALALRSPVPLVAPAALMATALGYGTLRLSAPFDGAPLEVGIVQAAVPQSERFQPDSATRNTLHHIALSQQLVEAGTLDLIVWSETAVDRDLDDSPALASAIRSFVDESGVPVLTGAPRSYEGRSTNASVLFVPGEGLVESYDKQRLVPFAEEDPGFSRFLTPLVGPVVAGEGYLAGSEATVFRRVPVPLSVPICFEIAYPALVRGFRSAGAELLVNISNDAWFGDTGYAPMHFAHSLLRAVELRSWVVRAANTGISAIVDPAGRVVARLGVFEEGTLRGQIRATRSRTLYLRLGDVPVLAGLALLVALAVAVGPGRAARRRPR